MSRDYPDTCIFCGKETKMRAYLWNKTLKHSSEKVNTTTPIGPVCKGCSNNLMKVIRMLKGELGDDLKFYTNPEWNKLVSKAKEHEIESRIASDPSICSGEPRIKDTRIRVADIVRSHKAGLELADIAEWYSLDVSDVRVALYYYQKHKSNVDRLIEEEEEIVSEYES